MSTYAVTLKTIWLGIDLINKWYVVCKESVKSDGRLYSSQERRQNCLQKLKYIPSLTIFKPTVVTTLAQRLLRQPSVVSTASDCGTTETAFYNQEYF